MGIALENRNFHKTKKIRQNKHFWWLGQKGKIGSEFRPICSQNFRSLAPQLQKLYRFNDRGQFYSFTQKNPGKSPKKSKIAG